MYSIYFCKIWFPIKPNLDFFYPQILYISGDCIYIMYYNHLYYFKLQGDINHKEVMDFPSTDQKLCILKVLSETWAFGGA